MTIVPTSTYLRNNKRFISSSRWILAVIEFEPSARRWVGGLGSSPHAQRTHNTVTHSLSSHRRAHSSSRAPVFFPLLFQCTIVNYFLADLDSGRLHGIQLKCYPFLSFLASYFLLFSMASNEMRRCPGNGGRQCGTYMSPLFRDPHALGVGVGHVLIMLHVRYLMVGRWINGNIIVVNSLMLSAVNHLHAMLAIPLIQLPTPPLSLTSTRSVSPPPPYLPLPPSFGGIGGRERGP